MPTFTIDTKTIAETILKQLGGNRFRAMTGAKNFIHGLNEKGQPNLSFKIPRSNKITHISIALSHLDLYDIEFIQVHGMKRTVLHRTTDVYNDHLQFAFADKTGLATHL